MSNAPSIISKLIETFECNIEVYKKQYNETQLRREFLDPFFEALGWDVQNKNGYAPAYTDVIHEDAIKIGSATKAPDYCFRIGGARKFFLEAKKPSIDIKGDPHSPRIPASDTNQPLHFFGKLPIDKQLDICYTLMFDCYYNFVGLKMSKRNPNSSMFVYYFVS